MQQILYKVFTKTNQDVLDSDINTELSGSTVVAVFQYKNKLICLNVGDSRAILCKQTNDCQQVEPQVQLANIKNKFGTMNLKQATNNIAKLHLSKTHKLNRYSWQITELSIDQKPDRQDQKQRILKNGGRVECNKTQKGEQIGPLRVWIKDIQMPGLAMTRSFGDKAGIRAGTCGQPEIIQHQISNQDKFIVIASDGVWQYLENQQVMNIITPFYLRNDIDIAAEKVVKLSTQIWGKVSYSRDDISIIIIALNPANK